MSRSRILGWLKRSLDSLRRERSVAWDPQPARDADGNVIPHDDPVSIPAEMAILRHVHPIQWTRDNNRGGEWRAQSAAFTYSNDGSKSMSIDCWPPMTAAGLEKTHYAFKEGKGVVELQAELVRVLGFRVGTEPIPGKNPHHAGIWPPDSQVEVWSRSMADKKRRELSRTQTFVSREPGFDDMGGT